MQNYNCKYKSNNIFITINIFITVLYFIWCQTPYIFRNTPIITGIMLITLWSLVSIMYIFTTKSIYSTKLSWISLIVIYWLGIVSIYVMKQLPNFSFGNFIYIIMYYFPIFMLLFHLKYMPNDKLKKLISICIFIMLLISISNIFILIENPYASKEVTGSYGDFIKFSKTNIISDIYILGIVLSIFIATIALKYSSQYMIRILTLLYILVSIILVIKSTFFIATITMILCFILVILFYSKNKSVHIKIILTIIAIIIFWTIRIPILTQLKLFVRSITDNYLIIERIDIVCDLIMNFNITGTLLARFKDILISINTFLENPLFGKGYIVSNDILSTGIGMHSHIFDDLARFGVIAFSIEMSIYFLMFKNIYDKINNLKVKRIYYICYIGFIFYSILNPVVYPQTGIILFFLLPLTGYYYGNIDGGK